MSESPIAFEIEGIKTLPIYVAIARTMEEIKRFSSGKVKIIYKPPEYVAPVFRLDASTLAAINANCDVAIKAATEWPTHLSKLLYFVQIKDDPSRQLAQALFEHTELVSTLCDARLGIDPSVIWQTFDSISFFESVHSDYRADPDRVLKYDEYAAQLSNAYSILSKHSRLARVLILRMVKQLEMKAASWDQLQPLLLKKDFQPSVTQLTLFYSYSHKDERLRDQLESHLTQLRRDGIIVGWHDRRISAGREWEGQIDTNLNTAHIILLLISADFIASDYCYDIEMKRALDRQTAKSARVIPVILRACDWMSAPFGKLQALPKDALPVTSWSNADEAFTDVAKGIRAAIRDMAIAAVDTSD